MTNYQAALTIDFHEMKLWGSEQPFRVSLETGPLFDLIQAAKNAHRVYELLLIDRPGDIWNYVWVVIENVPSSVAYRVANARKRAQPPQKGRDHPWPEDRIPFKVFDHMFFWTWDDMSPEDEAWLRHRDSEPMKTFARNALATARDAQRVIDWNDPLLSHVMSRMRSGEHPYCYLDRDTVLAQSHAYNVHTDMQHTPAFYKKLNELLRDAGVASVAYCAEGDYHVLRMMATEQRRRASLTGHSAENALYLSVSTNRSLSNEAWDSDIQFFEAGLAHGDLLIECPGKGGTSLKDLVEKYHRAPGRFILALQDEGCIPGFTMESGDGWVLYSKQNPFPRRVSIQRSQFYRSARSRAVLSFADNGATLFDHEKLIVLVGEEVPSAARTALASIVAQWEGAGGDPVLFVFGDTGPFDRAGCKGMLSVPVNPNDQKPLAFWFLAELKHARPWVDVALLLEAPPWMEKMLTSRARHGDRPWPAWIVSTQNSSDFVVDHVLSGDLEQGLMRAQRCAREMQFLPF